jgi:hypothetical protein
MIFPAMQKMPADLREKLPGSTNGAESAHNMLYQAAGRGHDIWEGVNRVQRETEMLYEAVTGAAGLRPFYTNLISHFGCSRTCGSQVSGFQAPTEFPAEDLRERWAHPLYSCPAGRSAAYGG